MSDSSDVPDGPGFTFGFTHVCMIIACAVVAAGVGGYFGFAKDGTSGLIFGGLGGVIVGTVFGAAIPWMLTQVTMALFGGLVICVIWFGGSFLYKLVASFMNYVFGWQL